VRELLFYNGLMDINLKEGDTAVGRLTGKKCVVKSGCLESLEPSKRTPNQIFKAGKMRNFGIFISNYQLIKCTFLYGVSDMVGIMMHASGKPGRIISDSVD
jgi:hypothetical protein